jgi:hypothetical protein
MYKNPRKRGNESYTRSPKFIYTTYLKEYMGEKLLRGITLFH